MSEENPIVGHKTFADGRHEPLRKDEADSIMAACEAREAKHAADMPDEISAINAGFQAYLKLQELGWKKACYCPKDGTEFLVIEPGSTGIHSCHYSGKWPTGTYWISDGFDLYPSRPVLFKPKPAKVTHDGYPEGS